MQNNNATLQITNNCKKPLTYACIWAFVNNHANGNLNNVYIQPLSNVKLNATNPVPFGYGGKVGGVRQVIQNAILNGVKLKSGKTCNSLASVLQFAKPLGHSSKKPICVLAMLNGGYSTSSATWGTSYIQLTVK